MYIQMCICSKITRWVLMILYVAGNVIVRELELHMILNWIQEEPINILFAIVKTKLLEDMIKLEMKLKLSVYIANWIPETIKKIVLQGNCLC